MYSFAKFAPLFGSPLYHCCCNLAVQWIFPHDLSISTHKLIHIIELYTYSSRQRTIVVKWKPKRMAKDWNKWASINNISICNWIYFKSFMVFGCRHTHARTLNERTHLSSGIFQSQTYFHIFHMTNHWHGQWHGELNGMNSFPDPCIRCPFNYIEWPNCTPKFGFWWISSSSSCFWRLDDEKKCLC